MPVSGVSVSSLFNNIIPGFQNTQLIQQEFQQLEQDLQSGNLSAAQSDSTALDHLLPQLTSAAPAQSSSPLAQALNQLSQDLQGGSLSAAQQDCSTIKQYFQEAGIEAPSSHAGGGGGMASQVRQVFSQLSKNCDLISRAQIYNIIQQAMGQSRQGAGWYSVQHSSRTGSNNLSVVA
jgi:hypothetical protein